MGARVSGLATTAVKSPRLATVERIELDELGARGNRAFCVIDDRGRMVNAKRFASLQTVRSRHRDGELVLTFPDGSLAGGAGPVRRDAADQVLLARVRGAAARRAVDGGAV